MSSSSVYVLISIATLAVIAVMASLVWRRGPRVRLTKLAALASGLVVAGITLAESRLFGYGLIGVGVFLAVIDMLKTRSSA
jgi:O-antigen ligase